MTCVLYTSSISSSLFYPFNNKTSLVRISRRIRGRHFIAYFWNTIIHLLLLLLLGITILKGWFPKKHVKKESYVVSYPWTRASRLCFRTGCLFPLNDLWSFLWDALRYKSVVLLELPLFATLGSKTLMALPKIKAHLELRKFPNVEDVQESKGSTKGHSEKEVTWIFP